MSWWLINDNRYIGTIPPKFIIMPTVAFCVNLSRNTTFRRYHFSEEFLNNHMLNQKSRLLTAADRPRWLREKPCIMSTQ